MHSILEFLHGKKATIVAIISLVTGYLASQGVLEQDLAVLINSIMLVLAGGADYQTKKLLGTNRK